MSLKDHFREAKNTLSISMLDSMKRREAFFLQNSDIFLVAVYADLRFRILLSPEEEQRGSEAFSQLFCRLECTNPGQFPTMAIAMVMNSSGN